MVDTADRIAIARLEAALREDESKGIRPGRLQEKDEVTRALTRRHGPTGRSVSKLPTERAGRPTSDRGQTFHFAVSHVAIGAPKDPGSLRPLRGRTWVFPGKGERAAVQKLGGRYDRRARAWHVPEGTGQQFSTASRQAAWAKVPRSKARGGRTVVSAVNFQSYVERADLDPEERVRQVVHDKEGPVSIGNIGEDTPERRTFWRHYAEASGRSNARIQSRIILEVPHELGYAADGPERIRRLAQEIVAPMAERGLPFHVAAHWPEVDKGSDSRNVHLHVLYGERVMRRGGRYDWTIGKADRSAQGSPWVTGLRDRYAVALNAALAELGVERRYDPRPYRESGVDADPTRHRGAKATALERSGIPTIVGLANAGRRASSDGLEVAQRQVQRSRQVVELLSGGRVSASSAAALVESLEQLEAAEAGGGTNAAGSERFRRRRLWLEREEKRLAGLVEAGGLDDRRLRRIEELRAEVAVSLRSLRLTEDGGADAADPLSVAQTNFARTWRVASGEAFATGSGVGQDADSTRPAGGPESGERDSPEERATKPSSPASVPTSDGQGPRPGRRPTRSGRER